MPGPRGQLRIYADRAGSVAEAVSTLRSIESAYLQLYAANLYFDELNDANFGPPRRYRIATAFDLGYLAPWPTAATRPMSSERIRRYVVPADDQLEFSAIEFRSPGFWEILGSLNPLEQIRKFLNDRHERKKDVDYRNIMDEKKMALEIERLGVELFSEKADALRKVGFSDEEIRRMLLPAARSLNGVAEAQDRQLIETAEIKMIEDKSKDDDPAR
jgi:hypothetical protein